VPLPALFDDIFGGHCQGFADPANTAFEAQIVPKPDGKRRVVDKQYWLSCAVAGPAVIGFSFDYFGAAVSYLYNRLFYMFMGVHCAYTAQAQSMPAKRNRYFKVSL